MRNIKHQLALAVALVFSATVSVANDAPGPSGSMAPGVDGGEPASTPSALVTPAAPAAPAAPAVAVFKYSGAVPVTISTASGDGQKLPDEVLRVVSSTERQKDVALLLVGAMLGSFRTPVSKEDYRGEKIEGLSHPAYNVLSEAIQRSVDGWIERNGTGRTFKNALLIRPDRFQLVYRGTDKEPDRYDLTLQATISRKPDSAGFLSWGHRVVCTSSDHQSDWTLADWRGNDNEKISAFIRRFNEECVATVGANLDKLLAP